MHVRLLLIGILFVLFNCFALSARADFTIFLGVNDKPTLQLAPGLALSFGLVIIGFEFEYVNTGANDAVAGKPSLQTGMGNLYVQTPDLATGLQLYGTAGGGLYREQLGSFQKTHIGGNLGGGIKKTLTDSLQLRLDYRIFNLMGDPLRSRLQRFYVGLNVKF
jgi:opacity protein-like surface antigen